MGTLMDTLFETWSKDPVHGEKRAYTKIGLALLHFLDKKKRSAPVIQSRKRTRGATPPPAVTTARRTAAGTGRGAATEGRRPRRLRPHP